ncbi:hypothetical protein [Streptomyces chrestomyceticus]|uniref:hypothetical protein n=1 Tax=Streptomyces chrestomyceticus TaxID=68185 RepID=UPI000F61E4FB|nr:hypothetical protein [Streptomyces chrestomyceticus]
MIFLGAAGQQLLFDARDKEMARLAPFVRHRVNMLGRYLFQFPELPGGRRTGLVRRPWVGSARGSSPSAE